MTSTHKPKHARPWMGLVVSMVAVTGVLAGAATFFMRPAEQPLATATQVSSALDAAIEQERDRAARPSAKSSPDTKVISRAPSVTGESDGYKGARWGTSIADVSKQLRTTLTPVELLFDQHHRSPTSDAYISQMMYELWGVPRTPSQFDHYSYYNEVVPSRFVVYHTASEDSCTFHDGHFYAYFFEVTASGYDTYLQDMIDKYGRPNTRAVSFAHPSDPDEQHKFEVNTWEPGGTIVRLIRERVYAVDMVFTNVYALYVSANIERNVTREIESAVGALRQRTQAARDTRERRELDKLQ